jgi:hypothetical protein
MTFSVPVQVSRAVSNHPYPLIFATVSSAHLYGFASPDSPVPRRRKLDKEKIADVGERAEPVVFHLEVLKGPLAPVCFGGMLALQ